MYDRSHFSIADKEELARFIAVNSFATLVSSDSNSIPFATHIPVLHDANKNNLTCHVARANPHWRLLESNPEVLVIFRGPHTFVPSSWYSDPEDVSTWNYSTVHAYGKASLIHDPKELHRIVEDLTRNAEGEEGLQRLLELKEEFRFGLLGGIVGIEIVIEKTIGKFKLSQNIDRVDQRRVIEKLETERTDDDSHAVAKMMRRILGISDAE